MNLYVWGGDDGEDYCRDWSNGIGFAIASSVEEARALLLKQAGYVPDGDLERPPKVFPVTEPIAFQMPGGS